MFSCGFISISTEGFFLLDLTEEASDIKLETLKESIKIIPVNEIEQDTEIIENVHAVPVFSTNEEEFFPAHEKKLEDEVDFKAKGGTGLSKRKSKRNEYEPAFDDYLVAENRDDTEDVNNEKVLCNRRIKSEVIYFKSFIYIFYIKRGIYECIISALNAVELNPFYKFSAVIIPYFV